MVSSKANRFSLSESDLILGVITQPRKVRDVIDQFHSIEPDADTDGHAAPADMAFSMMSVTMGVTMSGRATDKKAPQHLA